MWTGSRQTLADHIPTPSSVLGGEPPAADKAEGSQHFPGRFRQAGRGGGGGEQNLFSAHLFLAVLGLLLQGLSPGCGKRGLHSSCGAPVSLCGGFSGCRAPALGSRAQQLQRTGLVAPLQAGSSGTGVQACVPCVGKQTPNHWTSGGVCA